MEERAVYNTERGKWYRSGEEGFGLAEGVVADTYPEAFEKLYKHSVAVPPLTRSPRRVVLA